MARVVVLRIVVLCIVVGVSVLAASSVPFLDNSPSEAAALGKKKSSKAAKKSFQLAEHLLRGGKIDEGIAAVEKLRQKHADDPLIAKTETLLRLYGVGDEVRITLLEKPFFKQIQMTEKGVLEKAEEAIGELLPHFGAIKPLYKTRSVKLFLYESQAHYRDLTNSLNATGHFRQTLSRPKSGLFEGRIDWYYVPGAARYRQREFDRLLLHENAHYLNYAYFGGYLPSVMEEGIATFLESNLCKGKGVANKTLLKERQSQARNSLRLIRDDASFLTFLDSSRGMGRGGENINQWYSLCYAMVDFFAEHDSESGDRSPKALLTLLSKKSTEQFEKTSSKSGKPSRRWKGRALVKEASARIYEYELKEFRVHLVNFVVKNYKQ